MKNAKGNVVKVNFGDPNMKIKKTQPQPAASRLGHDTTVITPDQSGKPATGRVRLGKMKITKAQLKQIIKEELEEVASNRAEPATEYELYSEFLAVTRQLQEFKDNLRLCS